MTATSQAGYAFAPALFALARGEGGSAADAALFFAAAALVQVAAAAAALLGRSRGVDRA